METKSAQGGSQGVSSTLGSESAELSSGCYYLWTIIGTIGHTIEENQGAGRMYACTLAVGDGHEKVTGPKGDGDQWAATSTPNCAATLESGQDLFIFG